MIQTKKTVLSLKLPNQRPESGNRHHRRKIPVSQWPRPLTKKPRQKKTNNHDTNKENCPFSHNPHPETVNTNKTPNSGNINYPNLKSKSQPKKIKETKTISTGTLSHTEYNPLIGLDQASSSQRKAANQNYQQYSMVRAPVIQKTVYSRPNPPSTILASQNFPPFPPDPGNPPHLTSP